MRVCGRFTVTLFVSFRRYRAALRKSLNKIRQMFDYPRKNSLSKCTTIQPRRESNSSLPAPNEPPALQTNNQPQQDLTLVWAQRFLTFAGWNSVEIIMTWGSIYSIISPQQKRTLGWRSSPEAIYNVRQKEPCAIVYKTFASQRCIVFFCDLSRNSDSLLF